MPLKIPKINRCLSALQKTAFYLHKTCICIEAIAGYRCTAIQSHGFSVVFGIWQIQSFVFWNFLGLFLGNISDLNLVELVNEKSFRYEGNATGYSL